MCCKAKASCLIINQRTWTYNKQVGGWLGKVFKRIQNLSAAKSRVNICLTGCSKKNDPSRSGMTTQWHSALPSSPACVTVHWLRQQHQPGESMEIIGRKSTTQAGNWRASATALHPASKAPGKTNSKWSKNKSAHLQVFPLFWSYPASCFPSSPG